MRLAKEIMNPDSMQSYRIQKVALAALQEATEAHLVSLFEGKSISQQLY